MDASQVATLSKRQILALLLAIVCDIAWRLSELVVADEIGDEPQSSAWDEETGGSLDETHLRTAIMVVLLQVAIVGVKSVANIHDTGANSIAGFDLVDV